MKQMFLVMQYIARGAGTLPQCNVGSYGGRVLAFARWPAALQIKTTSIKVLRSKLLQLNGFQWEITHRQVSVGPGLCSSGPDWNYFVLC